MSGKRLIIFIYFNAQTIEVYVPFMWCRLKTSIFSFRFAQNSDINGTGTESVTLDNKKKRCTMPPRSACWAARFFCWQGKCPKAAIEKRKKFQKIAQLSAIIGSKFEQEEW
jgi:hypothetical protein